MTLVWILFFTTVIFWCFTRAIRNLEEIQQLRIFTRDRFDRVRRETADAKARIDDVLRDASIKMEEAAGLRRKGERKLEDTLTTNWTDW